MKEAYVIKAYRTAVGKAPRGFFKFKRPDELAAETIEYLISQIPDFDKTLIDDLIVGNAMPEAEQGFNVARLISLMGLKVDDVPGVTVNRFCASGLEACNIAAAQVLSGQSDLVIGGGVESMSRVPMGSAGGAWMTDPSVAFKTYFVPQGISADLLATKYNYSRDDVDL